MQALKEALAGVKTEEAKIQVPMTREDAETLVNHLSADPAIKHTLALQRVVADIEKLMYGGR